MKRRVLMTSGLAFGVGAMTAGQSTAQAATLNLYSARHYNTDEALYGNFADVTGIKINRVDAEPDPLVERLRAEGDKSLVRRLRHDRCWPHRAGPPDGAAAAGFLQDSRGDRPGPPARSRRQLVRLLQARARHLLQQGQGAAFRSTDLREPGGPQVEGTPARSHLGAHLQSVADRLPARRPRAGEDRAMGQRHCGQPRARAAWRRYRPDQGGRRRRGGPLHCKHVLFRQSAALEEGTRIARLPPR